ncbi:hypothetical protein HDU79_008351 [Rhizoclosmatium sp. JEL0117]|nr:hypothetical protein HDU79_008351 [Rhizoclosmatium sp. JEL0117]
MYLGIDVSTQSISGVISDSEFAIVATASVSLATLGFGSPFVRKGDEVLAPSRMFSAALEKLLVALVEEEGVDLGEIEAVSGCGQQHGSVFWTKGAEGLLKNLDPNVALAAQLADAFALPLAPIWMDSSSTKWCRALEDHVGGPGPLANLTGSRAYERFTGNQIAKIIELRNSEFSVCERISLISSMIPSLLAGRYIGIDHSDASGMNLLDIKSKQWVPALLAGIAGRSTTGDAIKLLLGPPQVPYMPIGTISNYFVERFGFSPDCKLFPFTGDNPSTLAGLGISAPGDLAISLGTSDTAFAVVEAAHCRPSGGEGHVLVNPVDPSTFIVMLCFKNGSLAREAIRDKCCFPQTWDEFNKVLSQTPPGNLGYLGFFHPDPEITPPTAKPATHVFAPSSKTPITPSPHRVPEDPAVPHKVQVRAVVETHCLRLQHHARFLGVTSINRILVSGGASANDSILQVLANVFNVPVYLVDNPAISTNAAAYGGCLRAAHGLLCADKAEKIIEQNGGVVLDEAELAKKSYVPYDPEIALKVVATPQPEYVRVYAGMLERFGSLEKISVELSQNERLW